LFPYRSNDVSKLKNYIVPSSNYSADLIIDRIEKAEINDKNNLKFIFRSYPEWQKLFIERLVERNGITKKLATEKYFDEFADYFYRFPNQSGSLSKINFHKVRISNKDYDDIRKPLK